VSKLIPRRLPWLLLISALIVFADRLTKTWVALHIRLGGAIPIIPRPAHHSLDQRGRCLLALR
jgi:lipoprotein signal peptidase